MFGQFLKKAECSQVSWLGSSLHAVDRCGGRNLTCVLVTNSAFCLLVNSFRYALHRDLCREGGQTREKETESDQFTLP